MKINLAKSSQSKYFHARNERRLPLSDPFSLAVLDLQTLLHATLALLVPPKNPVDNPSEISEREAGVVSVLDLGQHISDVQVGNAERGSYFVLECNHPELTSLNGRGL
jgi:hypothetical protein